MLSARSARRVRRVYSNGTRGEKYLRNDWSKEPVIPTNFTFHSRHSFYQAKKLIQNYLVKNACEKFHDKATSSTLSIKISFCSGDRCPQMHCLLKSDALITDNISTGHFGRGDGFRPWRKRPGSRR